MLQVLRDAADYMSPVAASQGQSLMAEMPSSLPLVRGDSNRLHQVVMNLLGNALKFTPSDGRIRLTAKSRDGSIVVEVQDTGPGIAKEDRDRLFEPYHRLESDRGHLSGLGLGLALCKTLVELHGGEIWVRSRVGKGSTFGFSIPLKGAAGPSIESGAPAKLWKVLIIEDDHSIVDSIGLAFQMDWPEAELVSSRLGEEGVDMVETEEPDIVILDLGLPDVSGFEVLRRIRLFSSVPIIVLTVRADEPDIIRGLEWGADDYIAKPFRQKELLARLKVQLRKHSRTDEETPITSGPLRLDPTTYQLKYGSREISLTIIEGRIMQCLMRNVGNVVTHSRLAEAVWGEDYPGALDSLRVYIGYLRGKLEGDPGNPKLIRTKAGVGYSLVKPV
jgi:two-component system KDP operon response regulator KdpE